MRTSTQEPISADQLQDELEQLEGVSRAIVDGPPWRVHLICEAPASGSQPVEPTALAVLTGTGIAAADVGLSVSYMPAPEPRRRVRFMSAELQHLRAGVGIGRVALEWRDIVYHGRAEGESNQTADLRLAALATTDALKQILPASATFQLIGIKPLRVFDRDMVVVLLRWSEPRDQQLIGACLVSTNPFQSAALAVLNATNRVLGNYLSVGD